VVQAEDPRRGMQLAELSRPELVVVDVDTAHSAAELVHAVRRVPGMESSVLLASTSEHRQERLARTMESGFQGILVKPLDIDSLAHELARHLAGVAPDAPEPLTARPQPTLEHPIHPLWRKTLAPIVASVVQSTAAAYGLLALHDGDALVVVAAHSLRPAEDLPPIGTRVPLSAVEWLLPALRARQAVVMRGEELKGAPLVPVSSTILVAAPVADDRQAYGVAVLGERRQRPFGLPEAQVAQCVAEATRIGRILQEFERRDEAIRHRRTELDHARLAAARAIATGLPLDLKGKDAGAAGRVRLGLDLAERLGVPVSERSVLEQALEVRDLGRIWLQRVVSPLVALPDSDRQAIVDAEAVETCGFVRGLGWPEPVLELIEASRMGLRSGGDVPLAARILAVVAAYQGLADTPAPGGKALTPREALAQLRHECGSELEAVLTALAGIVEDERA
jgi:CheY-like chemotaxis protein